MSSLIPAKGDHGLPQSLKQKIRISQCGGEFEQTAEGRPDASVNQALMVEGEFTYSGGLPA